MYEELYKVEIEGNKGERGYMLLPKGYDEILIDLSEGYYKKGEYIGKILKEESGKKVYVEIYGDIKVSKINMKELSKEEQEELITGIKVEYFDDEIERLSKEKEDLYEGLNEGERKRVDGRITSLKAEYGLSEELGYIDMFDEIVEKLVMEYIR